MCICDTFISQIFQHMPGRQLQGETEEVGLDRRIKYPPLIPPEPPGLQVLRWFGSTLAGLKALSVGSSAGFWRLLVHTRPKHGSYRAGLPTGTAHLPQQPAQ